MLDNILKANLLQSSVLPLTLYVSETWDTTKKKKSECLRHYGG